MFYQTTDELQALKDFRDERDLRAALAVELYDFTDIYWSSNDHRTKEWAQLQIKSIKHELDQLA